VKEKKIKLPKLIPIQDLDLEEMMEYFVKQAIQLIKVQ